VAANRYVLHLPATESSGQTGSKSDSLEIAAQAPAAAVAVATGALRQRQRVIERRLLTTRERMAPESSDRLSSCHYHDGARVAVTGDGYDGSYCKWRGTG
jgi:hypothetical protein